MRWDARNKQHYVYLAERADGHIKIGLSQWPEQRVKSLSSQGYPYVESKTGDAKAEFKAKQVRLLMIAHGGVAEEKMIHERMREFRSGNSLEWFRDTPQSRLVAFLCFCEIVARRAELEFAPKAGSANEGK